MSDNPTNAAADQEVLLARYRENCAHLRHLDMLLERTTSMVAQTSGVMLGLAGYRAASGTRLIDTSAGKVMPSFFILLGTWGMVSSIMIELRARPHRRRVRDLTVQLRGEEEPAWRPVHTIWIWIIFHACVAMVGVVIYVLMRRS